MKELTYKKHLIIKAEHIKLVGKYEIYDTNDIFICRAFSINDAKLKIKRLCSGS